QSASKVESSMRTRVRVRKALSMRSVRRLLRCCVDCELRCERRAAKRAVGIDEGDPDPVLVVVAIDKVAFAIEILVAKVDRSRARPAPSQAQTRGQILVVAPVLVKVSLGMHCINGQARARREITPDLTPDSPERLVEYRIALVLLIHPIDAQRQTRAPAHEIPTERGVVVDEGNDCLDPLYRAQA